MLSKFAIPVLIFALVASFISCGSEIEPPDETAPTVVSTTPENDAIGVDLSPTIVIKFSEPMLKTYGITATTVPATTPPADIPYTVSWSSSTELKITFTALTSGTKYSVTLNPAGYAYFQDEAENALAKYTLTFTTL